MKRSILLSGMGLLALPLSMTFAADIPADSRIVAVTVYTDSALVTRQAQVKVAPGQNKVIFADIVPEIDENSLKVSINDAASVKLLGAQLKQEYLEQVPAAEVQKLRDQVQEVQDKLKREQDVRRILSEEKNYLDSVRFFSQGQLPKDLVTKVPTPAELEGLLKFLDLKLKENFSSAMESDLRTRELSEKFQRLQLELSKIEGPIQKLKRSIVVEVDAPKAANPVIDLSYLVRGATWQPLYDARADFGKSEVELVSYAVIRQTTGDEWQNVDTALSTARPSVGGNMPYVAPWVLRPYQPRPMATDKSIGFAGGMRKMALQSQAFDRDEMANMAAEAPAVEYATAQEKGIAIVYKIPRKVSIKSDGQDNKLPVSAQMLKADFEYSAFPRAVPSAFLGSRVTNAKDLQLLGGRVNVFLEGDFVGTSSLANIGPGEEFDLYLGSDENVKVKRDLIEKKVDETIIGNILSPTKKTTFKYKLTVENYKSRKIKVKLFEATPVSEDDRIKIRMNQVSAEPKAKDWKERKGVWLWELELDPQKKQEITYSFTVDHPREMNVDGL